MLKKIKSKKIKKEFIKISKLFIFSFLIFSFFLFFLGLNIELLLVVSSVCSSFYLMHILHSKKFNYIYEKKRYALSLSRLLLIPFFRFEKWFGASLGRVIYSIVLPAFFIFLGREFWALPFAGLGVFLYLIFRRFRQY